MQIPQISLRTQTLQIITKQLWKVLSKNMKKKNMFYFDLQKQQYIAHSNKCK